MTLIASYCLTEPGSGSDAAALRTRAMKDGDSYILNGSKAFISGAGTSDIYLVMARTGEDGPKGVSAFVVEKDTPGLSFGAQERKMGWNSQPTAMVMFDDCRVSAENRIGAEGDGFSLCDDGPRRWSIEHRRLLPGRAGLALETARTYVGQRQQFGRRLSDFQALQFKTGRYGDRIRGGAADGPQCGRRAGQGRSASDPTVRHGQAVRHRCRL